MRKGAVLPNGSLGSTATSVVGDRQLQPTALILECSDQLEAVATSLDQFGWRVFLADSVPDAMATVSTDNVDWVRAHHRTRTHGHPTVISRNAQRL